VSQPFDRRITPARPDLAAAHLYGRVEARRFVVGAPRRVAVPLATLSFEPAAAARAETQGLYGEPFTVYEERDGWTWGQLERDGYVGWLPAAALADRGARPTHRLEALASQLYPEPDLKARPLSALPFGALLQVEAEAGRFARLTGGGFVPARHLSPLDAATAAPVATARRFLGAPYLWGGRSAAGLDCSALVQLALMAAGIAAPRDSDQQQSLGRDAGDPAAARPGDLLFFPGHVGFVTEGRRFLHANAHWMAAVEEPLDDVLARAVADGAPPSALRRLA